MDKNKIQVNKIYQLDMGEFGLGYFYELIKVTKIADTHIEGYRLEYPSEKVGVNNNQLEYLKPLPVAEWYEIKRIKEKHLPKINQDDINDMLIDLNTKKVGELKW